MAGHITHGLGRSGTFAIPSASMGLGGFIVARAGRMFIAFARRVVTIVDGAASRQPQDVTDPGVVEDGLFETDPVT